MTSHEVIEAEMNVSSSPIDFQHDQGDELSAQPALTRRATIGDPVYDNQAIVRQRRKAAVVACDRCRRRKIRCDGSQPCATCARFGVRCARPEAGRDRGGSSAEHAALADRVRQLEARLAAVSANEQTLSPSDDAFEGLSGRPTLQLDTSFNDLGLSRSFSFNDMQNDSAMTDESLALSVPTIQITGPHGSIPGSPLALSPSPSLFSGTSRASSPDPFSAMTASSPGMDSFGGSMLVPFPLGNMRTPPMSQWAEVYDRNTMLQAPESPLGPGWISRRSSISSFGGLDQGFCAMNLEVPTSPQGDWNQQQNPFDNISLQDFADNHTYDSMPTKTQAEVLAEHAFGARQLPLERTAFRICLEAVYEVPDMTTSASSAAHTNLSSFTSYSPRMARCLVHLVLCIGLKAYEAKGGDSAGIEACYALAHEQMRSADFWAEMGAPEVTGLLAAFASISTQ